MLGFGVLLATGFVVVPNAPAAAEATYLPPPRSFELAAFEGDVAIGRMRDPRALAVWTPTAGVEGPIALPADVQWVGMGNGALYMAHTDGRLDRAADRTAALAGRWRTVTRIPGAITWDAAGPYVVAGAGLDLHVSRDGGQTFVRTARPTPIADVRVREDGTLLVAERDTFPFVGIDAGREWIAPPAPFADAIASSPRDCSDPMLPCRRREPVVVQRRGALVTVHARCIDAALAADGRTWVERPAERARNSPFDLTTVLASQRMAMPGAPAANGPSALAQTVRCLEEEASSGRIGGGTLGRGGDAGLRALQQHAEAKDDNSHRLLSDAECDASGVCRRAPTTIAVSNRNTLRLERAPCVPQRLAARNGFGVLLCRAESARMALYVSTGDSGWKRVGEMPELRAPRIDVADDGAVLVSERTAGARAFLVVRGGALLDVTHPAAMAYRVVHGGRALVIAVPSKSTVMPLQVDLRGSDSKPVFDGRYYDAFTDGPRYQDHPLVAIVHRCVGDGLVGAIDGVLAVGVRLDADGHLLDVAIDKAPSEAARVCLDGAVRGLSFRKPPAAVESKRYLGFVAHETRSSLWLRGASGAAQRLGDDVDVREVLDLRVAGGHVVAETRGGTRWLTTEGRFEVPAVMERATRR